MLALSGLGTIAGSPTLAFDEIDAGIGGNTARAVGERLRDLAAGRQVLCITHLPQVASMAATHFRITKGIAGGATLATVSRRSRATSSWPRSCACSVPSVATRRPRATRASCWPPSRAAPGAPTQAEARRWR